MTKTSCPVCHKELVGQSIAEWPQFPFCGHRCKLVDLGRWLNGSYRVAAEEEDASPPPEDEDTP